MIDVEMFKISLNAGRIAAIHVRYHDCLLMCDLCLYKREKLWIRMPERWTGVHKIRYIYWDSKEISDKFQNRVLEIIRDKYKFDLPDAVKLLVNHVDAKKADKNKEKIYSKSHKKA